MKPTLLPVSSFASPADCSAQHSKQGLPGTCQGRLYQIRFLKQKVLSRQLGDGTPTLHLSEVVGGRFNKQLPWSFGITQEVVPRGGDTPRRGNHAGH